MLGGMATVAQGLLSSAGDVLSTRLAVATGKVLGGVLMAVGASNLVSYAVPQFVTQNLRSVQDLGEKYASDWAVVTGSSSGLGAAIATKLLSQGTNVVLVALDNDVLKNTTAKLRAQFPGRAIRSVGVDMSKSDECLAAVVAATEDIDVGILFNNAGYVYLESFEHADLAKQMANIEVLVLSSVKLTDHFYKLMIQRGRPGAIAFTSSQASFFPSPLSTVYSGSKAFIASYAQALAVEAKAHGIDVLSLQPGYMRTNFIDDLPDLSLWSYLNAIGQFPEEVADNMFRSVGRITMLDSGAFSWGSRLITKLIDLNPLIDAITVFSNMDAEYRSFHGKAGASSKSPVIKSKL